MSPRALSLFRLIERLARRTGYACVKLLETLAGMYGAALSTTRGRLAELVAAGWIGRTQTRKGGVSKLFFWPLVRVAGRSRGLFAKPISGLGPDKVRDFSARSSGGYSGGYSPQNLAVTPSRSLIKKTPVGTEDDNTGRSAGESAEPCSVAVSLLSSLVSKTEAQELAREATRQKLTEKQLAQVIAAYRAQSDKVRNRGAWLREALRRGFQPPAPPVEVTERPLRVVVAPAGFSLPGAPQKPSGAPQTALQVAGLAAVATNIDPGQKNADSSGSLGEGSGSPGGIEILRQRFAALKGGRS